jgi:hypothetical protein
MTKVRRARWRGVVGLGLLTLGVVIALGLHGSLAVVVGVVVALGGGALLVTGRPTTRPAWWFRGLFGDRGGLGGWEDPKDEKRHR